MPKSTLYTRTGDNGTTSLVGGSRVKKNCSRLEAYGTLDEFSAHLGVVLSDKDCPEHIRQQLRAIQNMLFNLGGYLACESAPITSNQPLPTADPGISNIDTTTGADIDTTTGADGSKPVATPEGDLYQKAWGLTDEKMKQLENWIDTLDEQTPKINAFVLPGGTPISAQAHVARTVCRRAERRILALAEEAYVDPELICYINRLSDYLFILARYFNFLAGIPEITWHKD